MAPLDAVFSNSSKPPSSVQYGDSLAQTQKHKKRRSERDVSFCALGGKRIDLSAGRR